jgi:hypothetical protein
MVDLDRRDAAALTEYMIVLEDVGDAREADSLYVVVAQSGREYTVDAETGACECDDAFYRDPDGGCKHVRRVAFATGRCEIPAWVDRSRVDPQLGIHVDDVQSQDSDDIDRGRGVETDGGEQGAIDQDFEDAERSYEEQLEAALEGVNTEPMQGGVAIDLVTRQPLFIRQKKADTLAEYYEEEGFDLATYNEHPFMPVRPDDAVFECAFIEGPKGGHNVGKTYDYPRGRLMTVPIDLAWRDTEVDAL